VERLQRAARVLGIPVPNGPSRPVRYILCAVMMLTAAVLPSTAAFAGSALSNVSVALSDTRPTAASASVSYTFTGTGVTATNIECIQVVIATTATGTTAPTGFSGASAAVSAGTSTLVNSSGSGWSLATSGAQNNILQYTNSTGITPSTLTGATFVLTSLTNPTLADTAFFYQLTTYNNTNCTSSPVDNALSQFITTNGSTVSFTIDATLSFSINAIAGSTSCDGTTTTSASTPTTIPFGSVTAASDSVVCQDLRAATNASNGYTIYLAYTGPPQSLSNSIAGAPGSNASPAAFPAAGVEAYGYSTSDTALSTTFGASNRFTSPSQEWAAATTSNAEVAYQPSGVGITDYDIAHQAGVSTVTHAGNYTTTIIYTCTPIY
jgi:hypothetical protein